ncbi:DgyrCDS4954 [Dimorphilus gyrociliatus]|uniref:DgyrCDS4954 n=1 Tax=Dimorphilus gyrociliatus TaxID=2664684 RepID=A0A7I8VN68_9ANNE|nr:DgyrCDS4954 [Dimorphilus gyrociliatus]
MDVFFVIRWQNKSIFLDVKESNTIYDLKLLISGIMGKSADDMQLYNLAKDSIEECLENERSLAECGLTANVARAQSPAQLGVTFRMDDGGFENMNVKEYSSPPELPDVMKKHNSVKK